MYFAEIYPDRESNGFLLSVTSLDYNVLIARSSIQIEFRVRLASISITINLIIHNLYQIDIAEMGWHPIP